MEEDDLFGSVTFRPTLGMVKRANAESGKKKKYANTSEWYRSKITRGEQFDALLTIYNDPEKRIEFESKLQGISKAVNLEQYMATIDDPKMLDSIIFIATNQRDAKVKQLLIDFQSTSH